MNYIMVNRNGLETKLKIIEINKNEIIVEFEDNEDMIIFSKSDLKYLVEHKSR